MAGVTFPGCPETFFSGGRSRMGFEEAGRSEQERDRHQKLHRIQQGDIFAVPLGTVYWFYNHGDQDLILLTVFDLNNKFNQLDNSLRVLIIINFHFFLISIYSEFIKSISFIITKKKLVIYYYSSSHWWKTFKGYHQANSLVENRKRRSKSKRT